MRYWREYTAEILPAMLALVDGRFDSDDPVEAAFDMFFELSMLRMNEMLPSTWEAGNRTATKNATKYAHGISAILQVNALPPEVTRFLIANWNTNNTDLISTMTLRNLANTKRIVRESAFTGRRAEDIERELIESLSKGRSNLKLIARDQVGKLAGQLDMAKQTAAGVDEYYWRTARDEAVRSSHVEREGRLYRWDAPPAGGPPGMAIQCRCDAEPAFDRMLLEGKERAAAERKMEEENAAFRREAEERSKAFKK